MGFSRQQYRSGVPLPSLDSIAKEDVKIDFFVTEISFVFSFPFPQMWTDSLSLKGKRLDFYGKADTYGKA